jgi:phenylpyruvate tautomerase PptA (4-oxalocrotonate tautomerase family)
MREERSNFSIKSVPILPDPTIAAVSLAMGLILSEPPRRAEALRSISGPPLTRPRLQTTKMGHAPDLMEGHSPEGHRELVARCTALYAEIVWAPIERFRAAVKVIPAYQWSLGGVPATERAHPSSRST